MMIILTNCVNTKKKFVYFNFVLILPQKFCLPKVKDKPLQYAICNLQFASNNSKLQFAYCMVYKTDCKSFPFLKSCRLVRLTKINKISKKYASLINSCQRFSKYLYQTKMFYSKIRIFFSCLY